MSSDIIVAAIAAIPTLLTVVGTYVSLSTRIARLEEKLKNHQRELEMVEAAAMRHHSDITIKIDSITIALQALRETVIESIVHRKSEQDFIKSTITNLADSVRRHESTLNQLEINYEKDQVISKPTRRKISKN
jgi:exopolyphosphatase/pppGpp-phosphohydrolase